MKKFSSKNANWYVMQVRAGKEPNIKQHLIEIENDYGIQDLIVPEPLNIEIKAEYDKEIRDRYKHLMGYMFVKLNLEYSNYIQILQVENIYRFLGNLCRIDKNIVMYTPMFVREREIENVRTYLFDGIKKTEKIEFNIGDKVKIKDGDLIGIEGKIIDINDSYVKIMPESFLQKVIKVSADNLIHIASNNFTRTAI